MHFLALTSDPVVLWSIAVGCMLPKRSSRDRHGYFSDIEAYQPARPDGVFHWLLRSLSFGIDMHQAMR